MFKMEQLTVFRHMDFSATGRDGSPTEIGDNVTIGHNATIPAYKIKDNALIGMGSIILDNSVVNSMSFVAAGAVVTPGTNIEENQLWAEILQDLFV